MQSFIIGISCRCVLSFCSMTLESVVLFGCDKDASAYTNSSHTSRDCSISSRLCWCPSLSRILYRHPPQSNHQLRIPLKYSRRRGNWLVNKVPIFIPVDSVHNSNEFDMRHFLKWRYFLAKSITKKLLISWLLMFALSCPHVQFAKPILDHLAATSLSDML